MYNGLVLELPSGTIISLEQNNFLLADSDDNGSYALPFTARRTPANQRALGFPELLDNAQGLSRSFEHVDLFDDGRYLLSGTLRLLRFTPTDYELTFSYGASVVMAKLKATKLRDLDLGGLRVWKRGATDVFRFHEDLALHMAETLANPQDYDYLFAPYSNNEALGEYPEDWPRYANVNNWNSTYGFTITTGYVNGYAPGSYAPFPNFYPFYKLSACPCVKLAYLVRTMLRELGIPLEEDFFDAENEQLVLLGAAVVEDALIYSKATQAQAVLNGLTVADYWFRLGDVLPDISGAELLRKLADTFFLDISVSPTGALRLRRSLGLLTQPPALVLTRAATPAPDVDVSADLPRVTTAYRAENDDFTPTRYQQVDPNQLGDSVATFADLGQPDFVHQVRLVRDEDCYYQHDDNVWKFYSEHLDLPGFGLSTSETTVDVAQGIELVLETQGLPSYVLPVPGADWLGVDSSQVNDPVQRVPTFGQRAFAPTSNCIERSQALRLAYYRGRQPYLNPAQGTYPMLSASNRNLQGQAVGQYSLRLDGDAGTVAQYGAAVLPLKADPFTVTWPVWLSEEQFYQLDMARKVEIDGLHFAVRKVSLAFPLRQPAQLDLVLAPPVLNLPEWEK